MKRNGLSVLVETPVSKLCKENKKKKKKKEYLTSLATVCFVLFFHAPHISIFVIILCFLRLGPCCVRALALRKKASYAAL